LDDITSPSSLSSSLRSINTKSVIMKQKVNPQTALKKHDSLSSSIFGSGLISDTKGANGGITSNHDDHLIEKEEIESGSVNKFSNLTFLVFISSLKIFIFKDKTLGSYRLHKKVGNHLQYSLLYILLAEQHSPGSIKLLAERLE
jgi:hypothetical protein